MVKFKSAKYLGKCYRPLICSTRGDWVEPGRQALTPAVLSILYQMPLSLLELAMRLYGYSKFQERQGGDKAALFNAIYRGKNSLFNAIYRGKNSRILNAHESCIVKVGLRQRFSTQYITLYEITLRKINATKKTRGFQTRMNHAYFAARDQFRLRGV